MGEVEASVEVDAPLAEVWDLYFDERRWASWVDGFSSTGSSTDYPERGGRLSWRSTPAGRGAVNETVLEHQPRTLHRISYEDPSSRGQLETRFEMVPAGEDGERRTKVTQKMSYELTEPGLFGGVTDFLFIRSQMRRSLQRSLAELGIEARAQSR